ncbi:hypothetical protein NP233_g2699 [Leucocoprinus birnbaumii]|uniref:Glutamyl-tRNA(Gln) amidotransferase subunit B, mitochondrial n=1 Tax=Leucocoprinus birnbaumii TaxID=56174 RepID=A0AAD5VYF6_9AGAR|nr:hypothetical protein NP233_g2699 [Leucocoprinus birnbaumii]
MLTLRCCLRRRNLLDARYFRLFHDARSHEPVKADPRWPGWQVVIGIETHAQIKSTHKLFSQSSCHTRHSHSHSPNTEVSLFDAAFPGTLPRLNPICVDLALRTSLALQCSIQAQSSFDRKHYFYSDLPSGYQITQQYVPLAKNGTLHISQPDGSRTPIRIKQVQLEQDTAKSTFVPYKRESWIDLNRAGTGLMEIVSEADLRSPEEAAEYVLALQAILRAVGSSDGNMEDGSLRCDVNVSINPTGGPTGSGTRCEIKNLNSVKFMTAAIRHEIQRQSAILVSSPDARIEQETRGFNEDTFETFRLRSKEDAPDYRYMPDPNLGVLRLSKDRIEHVRSTLPELPWQTRKRLEEVYKLSERDIDVLLGIDSGREVQFDGEKARGAVKYFEVAVEGQGLVPHGKPLDPKVVMDWIQKLGGLLAKENIPFRSNPITAEQLGELVYLLQTDAITPTSARRLLRHMVKDPTTAKTSFVAKEGDYYTFSSSLDRNSTSAVSQETSDKDPLTVLCEKVVAERSEEVGKYRKGQKNVLNVIVGAVMKESKGRVDGKKARLILQQLMEES